MICQKCKGIFFEGEKTDRGRFCHHCLKKMRPCCLVCGMPCQEEYYVNWWGKICKKCYDPRLQCFSCQRQMTKEETLRLADGRPICSSCYAQAIFQPNQNILSQLLVSLKKIDIEIKQPISFQVVDLVELKKMQDKQNSQTTELGLCQIKYSFSPYRVISHEIFLLFGLPKPQFEGTLVHELFHAWISENCQSAKLNKNEIEGACEFIAYQFLKAQYKNSFWPEVFFQASQNNQVYGFGLRRWQNKPVPFVLNYLKNKQPF